MGDLSRKFNRSGIAYHRTGSGPVLVMLHGVGLVAESWQPQIASLQKEFDMVVPDLPLHGGSTHGLGDTRNMCLNDYTEALTRFVTQVTDKQVLLCGHSLGALIAIEIAARLGKKAAGLVALNTIYQRDEAALIAVKRRAKSLAESDSVIGVAETLSRWFGVKPEPQYIQIAEHCEKWLRANSVEGYSKAYTAFANEEGARTTSLDRLQCPTIFMTGAQDLNSSGEMTRRLAAYLGTRTNACASEAVVVAGAGHMMPLTHAEAVTEQIRKLRSKDE